MSEERTYLELSEDEGSHKFYEVIVRDAELSIRYGRIGDSGQAQVKTFPSADKARAEAAKKIAEKTRKGYAPAVQGERKKRPVTRRPVTSAPSKAKPAPILWRFETGQTALGIFIDHERCWVGNQEGRVFALDHTGQPLLQFQLPEGVKCLVGDHDWLYAGCDDGNVYDLTGQVPRLAYSISEDVDILWLDICGGTLAVSDAAGALHVFDAEEELLWHKKANNSMGWMVRSTQEAIYHGSDGVTAYRATDGKKLWHQAEPKHVLFGWQTDSAVYPGCGSGHLYRLDKRKGSIAFTAKAKHAILSNASSPDDRFHFVGDSYSTISCFDESGKLLWSLGTKCGSALSMQYFDEKLYLVTTDGTLACLDASEAAIAAAQAGTLPQARQTQAPKAVAQADTRQLETVAQAGESVVVECYKQGEKVRVRVVSPGFDPTWNVQFPRNLREDGARFVVDQVREAAQGGFYRAHGNIRRYSGTTSPPSKKKKR